MAIRNAKHKTGGMSKPVGVVAFTEPDVTKRGARASGSRVSRVGSTARLSGSGSAGGTL